jgi:lysophospholipase L1-like esterase
MHVRWTHTLTGLTLASIVGLTIPLTRPGAAEAGGSPDRQAPRYYLALGTSLSVGIQPDNNGEDQPTDEGYADQLQAALRATMPQLRLVKLGCPAETSTTMIAGGLCPYPHRSQLAEAEAFLLAHRGAVSLVTLDIGANDVQPCGSLTGIDRGCLAQGFSDVGTNLGRILRALRDTAGPEVPIVAMNYYNPFLAAWLLNTDDSRALAAESAVVATLFNALLGGIYTAFEVPVADVAGAFHSTDFTPIAPNLPLNVALICEWTWMCAPPPVGPNIHANRDGYAVISQAFLFLLR